MKPVLVTQRVTTTSDTRERRDSLDQRWSAFLAEAGLLPIAVPNYLQSAKELHKRFPDAGLLLTGGEDLANYGGQAPERDEVERYLLAGSLEEGRPVIGICRGMQVIQDYFGIRLHSVGGHVRRRQVLEVDGCEREVNSFHRMAAYDAIDHCRTLAATPDGVIKAFRSDAYPLIAMMWHPERFDRIQAADIDIFERYLAQDGVESIG